jgi:antitoxin YefM
MHKSTDISHSKHCFKKPDFKAYSLREIDFTHSLSTIFLYLNSKVKQVEISYSDLRQNLKKTIYKTTHTHEPFFITSHKQRKAVLISYDDYESLVETAYLLQNPAMAKRLLDAVVDVKKGKITQHRLIDEK